MFRKFMDAILGIPTQVDLKAPVSGEIVPIEEVPDQVFAQKMMGDGIAIRATSGTIVAPVDAQVMSIFPTGHAVGLRTPQGIEIVIHIGLDTVELKGQGFKTLIHQGEMVKEGTPLVEFDLAVLKANGKSPITPIVITNMDKVTKVIKTTYHTAEAGRTTILSLLLK